MFKRNLNKIAKGIAIGLVCLISINTYGVEDTKIDNKQELLKAQAIQLADEVGNIVGLDPRYIFAIWFVESGLELDYQGDMPDVYTDLASVNDFKQYFTKEDIYNGKVKTYEKIAIGPLQYYTTWINEELKYTFISEELGKQAVYKENGHMARYDEKLGFNRPHPLYLPDAMFNVGMLITDYMKNHTGVAALDKRFNTLPPEVKEQILFIYAGDRYHGDMQTAENYKNANQMHKALVSFYIDIYEKYGSLTNFFDGDRSKIRRIVMGDIDNSPNRGWTGKTNTPTKIGDREFNRTLLQEMTEYTKTGYNYLSLFENINNKSNATNNRFGVAYGFEAMNGGFYYYDQWKKDTVNVDLKRTESNKISGIRLFIDKKTIGSINEKGRGQLRVTNYNKETKEIKIGLDEYYGELGTIKGLLKVYPVKDAKVVSVGKNDTDGNYITFTFNELKDTYEVTYKHLSLIDKSLKKGSGLNKETVIGVTGHSGKIKKASLGIAVKKNSEPINPLELYGLNTKDSKEKQSEWLNRYGFILE